MTEAQVLYYRPECTVFVLGPGLAHGPVLLAGGPAGNTEEDTGHAISSSYITQTVSAHYQHLKLQRPLSRFFALGLSGFVSGQRAGQSFNVWSTSTATLLNSLLILRISSSLLLSSFSQASYLAKQEQTKRKTQRCPCVLPC